MKKFSINRIIFCNDELSLGEIISLAASFPKCNTRFLFHAAGSGSIIGSQTLTPGAKIITPFIDYRITHPYQQRMKRVVDVVLCLLFIVAIPFHFLLHLKPIAFIRAVFHVLRGNNTWVGYAIPNDSLPFIKTGVISIFGKTKGVPQNLLGKADKLYAKNYDWWQDLVVVFKNYRTLGILNIEH